MNIPNILTIFRFCLVLVFVYVFYALPPGLNLIWSTVVFLSAGLTDLLDGYIARKYNLVTKWGKLMDPLADKLMIVTVLLCLYDTGMIPLFVIVIVIVKEVLMIAGAAFLYKRRNQVVSANYYGKTATLIFYVAIVALILGLPFAHFILFLAVLATLLALVQYAYRNMKREKKA